MEEPLVLVCVTGGLGIVTLNRPKAINALSGAMIATITNTLERWRADPMVRAVLIEGNGEKGFCAGGDVREVRRHVIEGNRGAAAAFFAAEYGLNLIIGTFEKPIIAFQDGICFGGGLGLSAHARFRLGTERSKFAMPESAIGLFADVGVAYRMGQRRSGAAIGFLVSGQVVGAADAIALDLCDLAVASSRLGTIKNQLIDAIEEAGPNQAEAAIRGVLNKQDRIETEADFCIQGANFLATLKVKTAEAFIAAIGELENTASPGGAKFHTHLAGLCPTSILATFLRYQDCPPGTDMADALAADLRLVRFIAGRNDFLDGVRWVLEMRQPMTSWSPSRLDKVDVAALKSAMSVA